MPTPPHPSDPSQASRLRPTLWERLFVSQGRALASWLAVGVGLGAVLFFALPFEPSGLWAMASALVGALLLLCLWRRAAGRLWGFVLLSLSCGFLLAGREASSQPPMPSLPTHATAVSGTVMSLEQTAPHTEDGPEGRRVVLARATFDIPVDQGMAPLRRTLRVTLRQDDPITPRPGDHLTIRAMLRPPSPPSWPGGRDMQRESWFSGSAGSGYALGPAILSVQSSKPPILEFLRETVATRIRATLPGQTGAIAAVLLAGEGGGIDQATRNVFAASGLAHLLAVAGLHLGLVMGCVIVTFRLALVLSERAALYWPCREIAVIGGLVVGGGYVLLSGSHLPSLRAFGMACFVTLALLTGRRVLSMRALSCVALAILLLSPSSVLDVSFQMSFAAVMALIAGYDVLRDPLTRLRGEGGFWRVALSHGATLSLTSLLAGLATLPVSMAHFGVLQPWFVLANLVAVPIAAVWIMPAGLLALLLMPLHLEALPLQIMGLGVRCVQHLASWVAGFPAARIAVPAMPGWGLLTFMLGLTFLCLWRGRWRLAGLGAIFLAITSLVLTPRPVLLLSADAGLMAVVDQGVLLEGPHGSLERLTLEDWQQALALAPGDLPQACREAPCRMQMAGQIVLLRPVDHSDGMLLPPPELCRDVALFVSASPARKACPGVPSLDRFSVWRDGAWAVYARRGHLELISDRSWRGNRLWVPPVGWHGMPNLPLARSE